MSVDPVVGFVLFVGAVGLGVGLLTLVERACDWVERRSNPAPDPQPFDWSESEPELALPSSHIRIVREHQSTRRGAA